MNFNTAHGRPTEAHCSHFHQKSVDGNTSTMSTTTPNESTAPGRWNHPPFNTSNGSTSGERYVCWFCALFMLIVVFVPPSMLCCCCDLIGWFLNGDWDSGGLAMLFTMIQIGFESFLRWRRQSEAMAAAFFIDFLHPHLTCFLLLMLLCYIRNEVGFQASGILQGGVLSPAVRAEDWREIPAPTALSLFL